MAWSRLLSLGLLLVLLAAFVLLARFLSRFVAYPGAHGSLPRLDQITPPARLVEVLTADRLRLQGAFISSGRKQAPAVLYFHGNGESAALNLPLAQDLARDGIDTFLAEYRGYGGLPGRPSERGLVADARAAWTALAGLGAAPGRVVVVGRSLGSGPALALALESPPALLVLVSAYTSFVDMGRGMVGPFAPLVVADTFDNLGKIGKLQCPIAILHGTHDEVVPFRMGEALAAEAGRTGRRIRFVPLDRRGHNDIPDLAALLAAEIRRVLG